MCEEEDEFDTHKADVQFIGTVKECYSCRQMHRQFKVDFYWVSYPDIV